MAGMQWLLNQEAPGFSRGVRHLEPLLRQGVLCRTLPHTPKSPKQKYYAAADSWSGQWWYHLFAFFHCGSHIGCYPPITRWDHLLMGQRDKNGSLVEYYSQSGTLGKYVAMEDFRLQIPNGMLQWRNAWLLEFMRVTGCSSYYCNLPTNKMKKYIDI